MSNLIPLKGSTIGVFDSSDDEEEIFAGPPEMKKKAEAASLALLQAKSRKIYKVKCTLFIRWCKRSVIKSAMLAYLDELSKKYNQAC